MLELIKKKYCGTLSRAEAGPLFPDPPPPPILSFDHVQTRQELNGLVKWIVSFPIEGVSENWLFATGENMLLGAILFLLWNIAPDEEQTLGMARVILSKIQASIHKKESVCAVDMLFDKWRNKKWNIVAVENWDDIRALELDAQQEIIVRLQARINMIKTYT